MNDNQIQVVKLSPLAFSRRYIAYQRDDIFTQSTANAIDLVVLKNSTEARIKASLVRGAKCKVQRQCNNVTYDVTVVNINIRKIGSGCPDARYDRTIVHAVARVRVGGGNCMKQGPDDRHAVA